MFSRSLVAETVARLLCRSASERLETLVARPDWLPPEMHRRPQRPQQPQPA